VCAGGNGLARDGRRVLDCDEFFGLLGRGNGCLEVHNFHNHKVLRGVADLKCRFLFSPHIFVMLLSPHICGSLITHSTT
jgi:hypothetical protein